MTARLQVATLSLLLLSGCKDTVELVLGPPETADDCKVTAKVFDAAKREMASAKPCSSEKVGECTIGNDDAGRIIITTKRETEEVRSSLNTSKAE